MVKLSATPSADVGESVPAPQRHERIADMVLRQPFVAAKELARLFDVSLMTIHRDLDELEAQGLLRKVRGGATPQPSSLFESNVRYRMTMADAEKQALARFAISQVEPGQAVMLDESTTCLALARLLPARVPLTVITNALTVVQELKSVKEIHLIVLGGDYWPRHEAFCGLACEATAAALRADILFMSTTAIANGIAFQPDQDIAIAKRAMIAAAARRVLLVDHSKFGRVALHRLAPLREFDLVVVDDGIDEAGLRQLRQAQVPFKVVPIDAA
ncbi:MAG TPA: DeoR/GlpR family DNA-binding transcription regulator, partial [Thermomicrobiales bacterium]|nr:DeoR/GlpR family DNA-binding transcription regulator [Thermomicrobiales bacterium]